MVHPHHDQVPSAPRSPLAIAVGIVVALVVANAVGYGVYRSTRGGDGGDDLRVLAQEQRTKGVAALRDGQYERAIASLEAAQQLDPALGDVPALLEVARKLERTEARAAPAPGEPPPSEAAAPAPGSAREDEARPAAAAPSRAARPDPRAAEPDVDVEVAAAPRRADDRDDARERAAASAAAARARAARSEARPPPAPREREATGALLVTTTPPKLMVKVDGQARDFSPVRLELPPGKHTITIVDGGRTVHERTLDIAAGSVAVIDESFPVATAAAQVARAAEPLPRAAEAPARSPEPAARTVEPAPRAEATKAEPAKAAEPALADDPKLDLAKLADRAPEDRAPEAATAEKGRLAPPAGGPPRLVVYAPGKSAAALGRSLGAGLGGIDVRVLVRAGELKDELASKPADAVLASPSALAQSGLKPAISGVGSARWVAVSLDATLTRDRLPGVTIGVVDELGRKGMAARVADILGAAAPTLRRVTKLEDLVSTLQLDLAKAVIVRDGEVAALKARTQRPLNVIELRAAEGMAVAFVDGGRRAPIERAILALDAGARAELGVERWASR